MAIKSVKIKIFILVVWAKITRNIGLTQQHYSEFQLERHQKLHRLYQNFINTAYALAVINKHAELLPCFNGFVTNTEFGD